MSREAGSSPDVAGGGSATPASSGHRRVGATAAAPAVSSLPVSRPSDAIGNVQGMLTARRQRRGALRLGRIASPRLGHGGASAVTETPTAASRTAPAAAAAAAAAAAPAAQKQQPPASARRRKPPARGKPELVREESQGPVAWPSSLAEIRAATVKEMETKCVRAAQGPSPHPPSGPVPPAAC